MSSNAGAFLGIKEASARLGVSVGTLRRWDHEKRLCPVRDPINGYRRYRVEELDAFREPERRVRCAALDAPRRPFFGRAKEQHVIASLLRRPGLVTLVGSPGAGKTRLALEVARRQVDLGPWRIVELGDVTTREAALAAVARTCTLDVSPREPLSDAVTAAIVRSRARLLLDDVDRCLDAIAPEVARWRALGATMLATSREALRLEGEQVVRVHGLPLPGGARASANGEPLGSSGVPGGPEGAEAGAPGLSAAIELLLDRAGIGSAPSDGELAASHRIAARVDGNPLALELAGARAKRLGLATVERELRTSLGLDSRERGVVAKHTSLDAAVAFSLERLSPGERRTLDAAVSFEGGFTVEAVSYVARPWASGSRRRVDASATRRGNGDDPRSRAERTLGPAETERATLDALTALVDRNLIQRVDDQRFTTFAIVRDVGRRLRPTDLGTTASARHAAWYARWAARMRRRLEREPSAVDELAAEAMNLARALHVATETNRLALATSLALAAEALVDLGIPCGVSDESLERVAARTRGRPSALAHRLVLAIARRARRRGDLDAATRAVDDAVARHEDTRDSVLERARIAVDRTGDEHTASILADAAERIRGHRTASAELAYLRGVHARRVGQLGDAELHFAEAAERFAPVAPRRASLPLFELADLRRQARHPDWERVHERAREHAAVFQDRRVGAWLAVALASALQDEGRLVEARLAALEALEACERLTEAGVTRALALATLATIEHELVAPPGPDRPTAPYATAANRYDEALEALGARGLERWEAFFHACRAVLDAEVGDARNAERRLARARELLGAWPDVVLAAALEIIGAAALPAPDEPPRRLASADEHAGALERSEDVRLARRLAARIARKTPPRTKANDGRGSRAGSPSLSPPATAHRWSVASDGAWFSLPSRRRVDVPGPGPLRRVLAALARTAVTGTPLAADALQAAGWPDEQVSPLAGRRRLHDVLSRLRRVGLAPILERRGRDGYRLCPMGVIEIAEVRTAAEPIAQVSNPTRP